MAAPFRQAAHELQVHPATLRRWLREGAPQVRRGRRGKGGAALIDVAAIRAWRGQGAASATTIPARVLAAEVPELLASAICEVFHAIDGPHKRACADVLAAAWYSGACALRDRLAEIDPAIPEIDELPEQIAHLRDINRDSGRL